MKKFLVILALLFSLFSSAQDSTCKKDFFLMRIAANVFDVDSYIMVTEDLPRAIEFVKSVVDSTVTIEDFIDNEGIVFTNGTLPPVLWIPRKPMSYSELAVLNHEIFHLISTILRSRHVQLSDETEEVYAYMTGFYSKIIYLNFDNK